MCSQSGTKASYIGQKIRTDTDRFKSDGIARVHGMSNVQAEELVEYVNIEVVSLA